MVIRDDSCLSGCEFESQRRILDGHDIFSHRFVVKIVSFVCLERPKICKKSPWMAHFFKKSISPTVEHAIRELASQFNSFDVQMFVDDTLVLV